MEDMLREAVDNNMKKIWQIREFTYPTDNWWIWDIRKSLGMSLEIFSSFLWVHPTTVASYEKNEKDWTIQLSTLEKIGEKFNLEFVYWFCHKWKTLEDLIDEQAKKKALEIIESTYTTMDLEWEFFDKETLRKKIEEKKFRIKSDIKGLWK